MRARVAVVGRSLECWRRQPTFRCVYADHLSLEASSEASARVGDRLTPPTHAKLLVLEARYIAHLNEVLTAIARASVRVQ